MPQQQNHKYIFLLFRSFSDRELLNEACTICAEYRFQWTDQKQVISLFWAVVDLRLSSTSGNFEKVLH